MLNLTFWLQYIRVFLSILCISLYTYIKSRVFGNRKRVPPLFDRNCKIAVVGGGIGGVSAAYALLRSGYKNVTIYEARDKLGGNAKTHLWQSDRYNITTGLSVLAWPLIFRNYIHLLNELNIPTTMVELPFFIHDKQNNSVFAHGKQSAEYNTDLKRWSRMVNTVRWLTEYLSGKDASLYHFAFLNPFNYIPMRSLSLLFGVSNRFWHHVVVPMYASSFLSTKLSFIPSSILPTIDSLISLQPNQIPTMQTWIQTSIDVFDKMTQGATVKTNHPVTKVRIQRKSNSQIMININEEDVNYERIIFACNADATVKALTSGRTNISSLLKLMLSNVTYGDDDDLNLLDGVIHRDINILPVEYANELRCNYANYIDLKYDSTSQLYYHYNTFILSSWLPNVHAMLQDNRIEHETMEPMLVTYAPNNQPAPKIDQKKIFGKVDNRRAHPSLSFRNQTIALLMRLVQGENGMYFCGNAVTPANGHDLSLISGFAVAELIGAKYPFGENQSALQDFNRFKRMCVN
ncbi:unnamed protein product [Adineta ricciae]|uniref:Amine oxidase domain-containing protein n=1 Tax=Adineta ricciae TaxID=249248 RepID=A0A814NMV9_ADIRI|nr:unnamed protein product [Adineta ricciae]CAF1095322.1 unnamed protein product [Adineta ricciae]